jgi:hypothetical protein
LDSVDEVKLEQLIADRIRKLTDEWNTNGPSYSVKFRKEPMAAA